MLDGQEIHLCDDFLSIANRSAFARQHTHGCIIVCRFSTIEYYKRHMIDKLEKVFVHPCLYQLTLSKASTKVV